VRVDLAVPTVPLPTDRWPSLEVRWQILPDGGWISAQVLTPFIRVEWAIRWFDDLPIGPPYRFADRLWAVVGLAAEAVGA
jgi:hypothetical protein